MFSSCLSSTSRWVSGPLRASHFPRSRAIVEVHTAFMSLLGLLPWSCTTSASLAEFRVHFDSLVSKTLGFSSLFSLSSYSNRLRASRSGRLHVFALALAENDSPSSLAFSPDPCHPRSTLSRRANVTFEALAEVNDFPFVASHATWTRYHAFWQIPPCAPLRPQRAISAELLPAWLCPGTVL